ncbi:hypothetical protein LZC95_27510 [Pendulispora brunnea]|uniref:Zinc ribbon domain-containing protein n=1 Tax=Pendulispora brunnea TaxID=2905690 RepID=A0ABZ2JUP5_9BACT
MRGSVDPDHERKRSTISLLAGVALVVGAILLLMGVLSFGSVFFRPSSEFFADPHRVMDQNSSSAFTGILCAGIGGILLVFGARALFFARSGSILRYIAGETIPFAKDAAEEAGDIARGFWRGKRNHARRAKKQTIKVRCTACRHLEREDAKFCSGCGAPM